MNKQNAADLAELFRVLGMEEAARDVVREYTEAQKALTKREQRGDCVVLRPSLWNARPQKEGAREGSKLNGSALKTKAAPAQSKKGARQEEQVREPQISRSDEAPAQSPPCCNRLGHGDGWVTNADYLREKAKAEAEERHRMAKEASKRLKRRPGKRHQRLSRHES